MAGAKETQVGQKKGKGTNRTCFTLLFPANFYRLPVGMQSAHLKDEERVAALTDGESAWLVEWIYLRDPR